MSHCQDHPKKNVGIIIVLPLDFGTLLNVGLTLVLVMFGRLSFGIAVILLIVATSMSRRQAYGEGWLNGECYLVKGGIYVGSAILILVSVESLMGSALLTMKTNEEADQGNKIHAQTERGDT